MRVVMYTKTNYHTPLRGRIKTNQGVEISIPYRTKDRRRKKGDKT
jgi:hypothetical protein